MKQDYKLGKKRQSCALFQNDYTTNKLKLRGLTDMVGLNKLIMYDNSIQYFLSRAIMLV